MKSGDRPTGLRPPPPRKRAANPTPLGPNRGPGHRQKPPPPKGKRTVPPPTRRVGNGAAPRATPDHRITRPRGPIATIPPPGTAPAPARPAVNGRPRRAGAGKTPAATRAVTPARARSSAARTSRTTTARAVRAGGDAG